MIKIKRSLNHRLGGSDIASEKGIGEEKRGFADPKDDAVTHEQFDDAGLAARLRRTNTRRSIS